MVFLDWGKAFDKVNREKLIETMTRLGLPKKMIDVLASFYVSPQFRVKEREGKSTCRTQRAGIRQGCPLSQYFFICLTTVILHDVHEYLNMKLGGRHLDFFSWWELVYVDDTMLIGNRASEINLFY